MNTSAQNICEICDAIKRNDLTAFRQFYHQFYLPIYHFIYKYIYDSEAAYDIAQDTFLKFWLSRHKIDTDKDPKAYLYKIARNLSINYLERDKKYPVNEDPDMFSKSDTFGDYDNHFMMSDFNKLVDGLPLRCREVFILSRYSGLKYTEIAEVLSISVQTVKNQMNKALATLRGEYKKYSV